VSAAVICVVLCIQHTAVVGCLVDLCGYVVEKVIRWNNNNNNNQDNVYGAVIMAEPLREFTWFI